MIIFAKNLQNLSGKNAGFFTDHVGGIMGGGLGLIGGTALGLPFIDETRGRSPVIGGLLGITVGGGLGDVFDARRRRNQKKKNPNTYRSSSKELKEKGLSKEQIDEILKDPIHTKSSLDVHDKELAIFRPISSTIGKINDFGVEQALGIDTTTASLENPDIQRYVSSMKDHPALKNVGLYLGSQRPLDRLSRIWGNENNDFLDKLYFSATSPLDALSSGFSRADHFDPVSNTVNVYHSDPSILAHELGHALDYNTSKDVNGQRREYMGGPVNQEYLASNLAVNQLAKNLLADKKLHTKAEVQKFRGNAEKLEKALNSYVAIDPSLQGVLSSVIHQNAGARNSIDAFLTNPKSHKQIKALMKKLKIKDTPRPQHLRDL
jgi:hypothetical protein